MTFITDWQAYGQEYGMHITHINGEPVTLAPKIERCAICLSPVREVRPGKWVHAVEREPQAVRQFPGIDYDQVEVIAREVKPDGSDS